MAMILHGPNRGQPHGPAAPRATRPAWLPEPFETPEELAAAYERLRDRAGPTQAPIEAPVDEAAQAFMRDLSEKRGQYLQHQTPAETRPAAPAPNLLAKLIGKSGGGCVDCQALSDEYHAQGALSPESYAQLAAVGITEDVVNAFIEGQELRRGAQAKSLAHAVGGEERLQRIVQWALATMGQAEMASIDAALTGTPSQAEMMVRGLQAAYDETHGREPTLIGGSVSGPIGDRFENAEQVVAAMKDPRYRRDESYRQQIKDMLARSKIFAGGRP